MADPVLVACPENTWTKVATNVITGQVWRILKNSNYLHTYRMTGEAAPTGLTEAVPIFIGTVSEFISSSEPIDVYIYALRGAGKVRVDT